MPCSTFPIDPSLNCPITEIGLAAPLSQQAAGAPAPIIHWVKALVDTGCNGTSIHASAFVRAGLTHIGKKPIINTSNSNLIVNQYLGDLFLKCTFLRGNMEFRFSDHLFLELLQQNPNFDALLGTDILSLGVLVIDGNTKSATFSF
jgi:hypothetical protein